MKKLILKKLQEAELTYGIEILFAVESGSRAWGFPSTDSDYDVRFIYRRKLKEYLCISTHTDFIDVELNETFDIKGWDIQKVLRLAIQSNASSYEYLQSPIHYIKNPTVERELKDLLWNQFQPQKLTAHYLGITTKRIIGLEKAEYINLKSLFYALRSVLAAYWIYTFQTVPPMEFKELSDLIPIHWKDKISELIILKSKVDEKYLIPYESELIQWINTIMLELKAKIKEMPFHTSDLKPLDDYFYQTINNETNHRRFKEEQPNTIGMH